MTRDEAIEIAAKAAWREYQRRFPRSSFSWEECGERTQDSRRRMATAVYDALLAAGVIPAEGMVAVDAERWGRAKRYIELGEAWMREDSGQLMSALDAHAKWTDHRYIMQSAGDLDAIPDAPTGEGER